MDSTFKKKVEYEPHDRQMIVEGYSAIIQPLNHPNCSNTNPVRTTEVKSYNKETGVFETQNTVYIPVSVEKEKGSVN